MHYSSASNSEPGSLSLPLANDEVTAIPPTSSRYKMRNFSIARSAERFNWFIGPRKSKTLPRNFRCSEGPLSSSLSSSASNLLQSGSPSIRHSQLLGWTSSNSQNSIVASAGRSGSDFSEDLTESMSPLEQFSAAALLPRPEEDDDDDNVPEPLRSRAKPLSAGTRRVPQVLNDTISSGGMSSQEASASDLQRRVTLPSCWPARVPLQRTWLGLR